jgi:hypothetical protein
MSYKWQVDSELHSPTSPASFGNVVVVNLTPLVKNTNISRVRIRRMFLPNIIYNITANNNVITILIAAIPYTITIPVGYYSGIGIAATITALFNATIAPATYLVELLWDTTNFRVTISVRQTVPAPPPIVYVPYTLTAPVVVAMETPDVLQLLGFNVNPLVSLTGLELSNGPLNIVSDRYALITCDEAHGMNGALYSLGTTVKPWHDGLISVVPLTGSQGDIIEYFPEDDAPWITLSKPNTNNTLTFRLGRDRYRYFGPSEISWSMELEVE